MDCMQIRELLPHRYPFLLVDRIVEMDLGVRCLGVKNVTWNEPCYSDLPEDASREESAYPVHLLIESFAQVGAVLCLASQEKLDVHEPHVMLAGSVRGVSMKANVYPGELLFSDVRITRRFSDTVIIEGNLEKAAIGSAERTRVADIDNVVIAIRPKAQLLVEGGN